MIPCVRFTSFVPSPKEGVRQTRNTRYGWLARPYPTGTCTPQEATSFACRTNAEDQRTHQAGWQFFWKAHNRWTRVSVHQRLAGGVRDASSCWTFSGFDSCNSRPLGESIGTICLLLQEGHTPRFVTQFAKISIAPMSHRTPPPWTMAGATRTPSATRTHPTIRIVP